MKALSRQSRSRSSRIEQPWRETIFNLADARRALVYVAKVVEDAAESFRLAQECRMLLEVVEGPGRVQLGQRRDAALQRLNAAIDECNNAGVDLVDISRGVVSFKAMIHDRIVKLIWRIGDPVEGAWDSVLIPAGLK